MYLHWCIAMACLGSVSVAEARPAAYVPRQSTLTLSWKCERAPLSTITLSSYRAPASTTYEITAQSLLIGGKPRRVTEIEGLAEFLKPLDTVSQIIARCGDDGAYFTINAWQRGPTGYEPVSRDFYVGY